MNRVFRAFTLVTLPLLTLLLGWQLGVTFEMNALTDERARLEELSSGGVGSGALVTDPEKEIDLALFWGVWRLLLKHYISPQELKPTPLLLGAIEGMVRAIGDPYTVFMTPSQNKDFRDALEGKLQGIGAELTFRDGSIVVVAPIKGSPAEASGLLPEDIITEVDEVDTAGMNLQDVVQRIRGKKGTIVTLKIVRQGKFEPFTLKITRDDILIPSVELKTITSGSGTLTYIALNQFGDTSINEFKDALKEIESSKTDGLIIDLRNNGGGYLEGAVELVSFFLRKGKIVSVERRGNTELEHHYVYGRPVLPELPLAVIINQGSASASEIVAGALQDHARAKIIGMKSFGKGTVQEVLDLPGGSSLRVTTAHWLLPSGKNLGKDGVHPDITVDRVAEDYEKKRDPQLHAAEEWLLDDEDVSKSVKKVEKKL